MGSPSVQKLCWPQAGEKVVHNEWWAEGGVGHVNGVGRGRWECNRKTKGCESSHIPLALTNVSTVTGLPNAIIQLRVGAKEVGLCAKDLYWVMSATGSGSALAAALAAGGWRAGRR